jgi:cell division protein FtsI/penicillin-binding protein 2
MTRSTRRPAVALAVLLLLGSCLTACSSSPPGPQATVDAFVQAWNHNNFDTMGSLAQPGAAGTSQAAAIEAANLQVATDLGTRPTGITAGTVTTKGDRATMPLTSTVKLTATSSTALHGTLTLHRSGGHWRVVWSPTAISTALGNGRRFRVTRTWPARASILGARGASLTPNTAVVTVGVVGQRIKDPAALTTALVAAGLDKAAIAAALAQAARHPDQFTAVGDLPDARYEQVKPQIYPLPGTAFQKHSGRAPLTADLGAHVVGTVGPITAEQLKKLGAPYTAASQVGQSGIEAAYETQLAGEPTTTLSVVDATASYGATVVTRIGGRPARAVVTTIDPGVQRAAEGALAGVQHPAAIVAVRVSTGQVLASVSRPTSRAFDLALAGSVPPGSTFKVVTTAALLGKGSTPATTLHCPDTVTVDGKVFRNFEHETLGDLSLQSAFAQSCNTAFVGASSGLGGTVLPSAARAFGLGTAVHAGLPAFGGSVPAPATPVDLAATAIGQGKVLVSPLAMAGLAATVGSGSFHAPVLVAGSADAKVAPRPLPAGVATSLRAMMAEVVTSGTAAGAQLPAGTAGKTGTAEFGGGANPATHAWFVGYRGDIAFAVLVYGGGVGGAVAAPIAASFLLGVPG